MKNKFAYVNIAFKVPMLEFESRADLEKNIKERIEAYIDDYVDCENIKVDFA